MPDPAAAPGSGTACAPAPAALPAPARATGAPAPAVPGAAGAPRVPAQAPRRPVPQLRPTDHFAELLLGVLSGRRPVHSMLRHTVGRAYDDLAHLAERGPLRAMAFRLEQGRDLRWRCTAVEVGGPRRHRADDD
ncbi:hypothetical protein [Streptomyces ardesiacus]|uniref:hypothetical protein n=1 Tax=Streptomyces ardesiacus TaxID=285564 RepID=UPI003F49B576